MKFLSAHSLTNILFKQVCFCSVLNVHIVIQQIIAVMISKLLHSFLVSSLSKIKLLNGHQYAFHFFLGPFTQRIF